MADKEKAKESTKLEKQTMFDHIEYKRKMFQDEKLNGYIDKKRKQEELRNALEEQTIYKHYLPYNEPSLKSYDGRYNSNEPDKLYTLGGIKVSNVPIAKGKTRRQNLYLPPNPIVNPMPYFNQYIDPNTNHGTRPNLSIDHQYMTATGSRSVMSSSAHNVFS